MDARDQRGENRASALPPWVLDPSVRSLLESENIELTIVDDEKFRRGKSNMPLVVLRRIRPPNQYYLNINAAADENEA